MDEMTLLQHVRPDVEAPAPEGLARARERLMDHIRLAPQDRADHLRGRHGPVLGGGTRAFRARPSRALGVITVAAGLAAVVVVTPLVGREPMAEAAVLLTQASANVSPGDPPAPGDYRAITTRSEALSYRTDAAGEVTGAYVSRSVDQTYVPADVTDEWVSVSYSRPAQTFYGGASARAAADREYEQSATTDDPNVSRAQGGQFGNGELGGTAGGYATTADLDTLPRDPDELLDNLAGRSDGADSSRSTRVMDQISLLLSCGLVDSDLTATMYRTLALLPEVEITDRQTALDGRQGTSFGLADDEGFAIDEVIIDVDSGQFVGFRSTQVKDLGPVPAGTVTWSTAVTSATVATAP